MSIFSSRGLQMLMLIGIIGISLAAWYAGNYFEDTLFDFEDLSATVSPEVSNTPTPSIVLTNPSVTPGKVTTVPLPTNSSTPVPGTSTTPTPTTNITNPTATPTLGYSPTATPVPNNQIVQVRDIRFFDYALCYDSQMSSVSAIISSTNTRLQNEYDPCKADEESQSQACFSQCGLNQTCLESCGTMTSNLCTQCEATFNTIVNEALSTLDQYCPTIKQVESVKC